MRVLILAPTKADAAMTVRLLEEAGVTAKACDTITQVGQEILSGAGAVIVTDDADGDPLSHLRFLLERQPSWSELPVLVLARQGSQRLDMLRGIPGVVLLERPVHIRSMVSAVQAALRARARQYELRNQLAQTRAANQELKNQARAKDEFLATLSHELRNPLSALTTAAHLLDRESRDANGDLLARQVVKRQTALMGRLLDDLLDVARITRGRLEIRRVPTELSSIVKAAVETVQPLLNRKGHAFSVKMPDREVVLDADPVRLAQVLANLITNAAKYTEPRGRIDLLVQRHDGSVEFHVRDNGIGIAPEARGDIFKMFSQLSPAIDRSEGGLGIGLALAKGLVDLHDGEISVQSEGLGKGSEFIVSIPVSQQSMVDEVQREATPSAPRRCELIVADDNADALQSLAMLLEHEGHAVRVAADGAAALSLMMEKTPDLMLLDIGMPGLNGYEVARKVRECESEAGSERIMLVALTGWGQPTDRARAREAGFDHHLTKPLDFEDLSRLLSQVCDRPAHRPPRLKVVNSRSA